MSFDLNKDVINTGKQMECRTSNIQPRPPISNKNDRICDTCIKEDVCMYKEELNKAIKDISEISDRINVFIDTDIKCKKWSAAVSNYR